MSSERVADILSTNHFKPGYSGSPLFKDNGEVIGIVSSKIGEASFATRVDHLHLMLDTLQKQPPKYGYLDVHSTVDLIDGKPKVRLQSVVESAEFPLDKRNPLGPLVPRTVVAQPEVSRWLYEQKYE
jgi:S1-C subfamily serine protease